MVWGCIKIQRCVKFPGPSGARISHYYPSSVTRAIGGSSPAWIVDEQSMPKAS
jgi:hypothetical protein